MMVALGTLDADSQEDLRHRAGHRVGLRDDFIEMPRRRLGQRTLGGHQLASELIQRLIRGGDTAQNIYLQADDYIYIPSSLSQEIYILGAVTDPGGVLALSFAVPDFGFGPEDAVVLFEQVYLQDTQGRFFISSPSTHVIVDGAL